MAKLKPLQKTCAPVTKATLVLGAAVFPDDRPRLPVKAAIYSANQIRTKPYIWVAATPAG